MNNLSEEKCVCGHNKLEHQDDTHIGYYQGCKQCTCRGFRFIKQELEDNQDVNMVNHPPHYTQHPSGIECIEIIQWFSANIAAAVKYLWRAGLKTGNFEKTVIDYNISRKEKHIEDLNKAIQYVAFEIKRLGGEVKCPNCQKR